MKGEHAGEEKSGCLGLIWRFVRMLVAMMQTVLAYTPGSALWQQRVVKLRPHQHSAADTYCVYQIVKSVGGGAIPVGSLVCVYCPPGTTTCSIGNRDWIEVAPGIQYQVMVVPQVGGGCGRCPSSYTYE